jgi:hypothetical protein
LRTPPWSIPARTAFGCPVLVSRQGTKFLDLVLSTHGGPREESIMSTDLTYIDATEIAELIRTRKVSSVEVVQAHLDRIEAVDSKTNAVVTLADGALDAARNSRTGSSPTIS